MDINKVLKETGFEICEFPPDEDPCENCGLIRKQLYFQGPTDAGRYYCLHCIIEEYKANLEFEKELEEI